MSITENPIRTSPNAALHRDMDTVAAKLHALEVTAVRLAEERDHARQAVRGIEAATEALVAEHLKREAELEQQRDEARRERNIALANARTSDEMTGAMSRKLDEVRAENARYVDERIGHIAQINALTEAAKHPPRRDWRRRVR